MSSRPSHDMRINAVSLRSDSSGGKSWSYLRNKRETEVEEIVLPPLENSRSFIVSSTEGKESKQGEHDTGHNYPFPKFETGQVIQTVTLQEEEKEEGNGSRGVGVVSVKRNSVLLGGREASPLKIALAETPILHAEEVVPAKSVELVPLDCKQTGEKKPLLRFPTFCKESTFSRQHRQALLFNLFSREMECRVEIWREHAVDFYTLFMDENTARWRIMRQSLSYNSNFFSIVSTMIETFLDFLLWNDVDEPFTAYDDTQLPEMLIPKKPAKDNTRWSWRQMVRPWRRQRGSNKDNTLVERETHLNNNNNNNNNNTSGSNVGKEQVKVVDHKKIQEYQRVMTASRIYLLTRFSHHIRYAIWRDVLFSAYSKNNASVSMLPSIDGSSSIKNGGSLTSYGSNWTQWTSYLRSLRNVPMTIRSRLGDRRTPPRADALFATYDLLHPKSAMVASHSKRIPYGSTSSLTGPYNNNNSSNANINNNNNNNNNTANTPGNNGPNFIDEDSMYSASLCSDALLGASSSAPDASLMYSSACSLPWGHNACLSTTSQPKTLATPTKAIVQYPSSSELMNSRDVGLCGLPPSRSIYPMCFSSSMKYLLLILRMEYFARKEIVVSESARFNGLAHLVERSKLWVSTIPSTFLRRDSRLGSLCVFRQRNLVAQMVEEKSIAATRYEGEVRLLLLYRDFLDIVAEEERVAMEFYDFLRMERNSFLGVGQ